MALALFSRTSNDTIVSRRPTDVLPAFFEQSLHRDSVLVEQALDQRLAPGDLLSKVAFCRATPTGLLRSAAQLRCWRHRSGAGDS